MKNIWYYAVLYSVITLSSTQAKVRLFTYAYNRPDFIEIQDKLFKKFVLDDYEFIVFDDAPNQQMSQQIANTCTKLGIECVRFDQALHARPYLPRIPGDHAPTPSVRHAEIAQYSLDTYGIGHNDIVAIIDADMFLVKPFSFREYVKECPLAGYIKGDRIKFLWLGLIVMDMPHLPDTHDLSVNLGTIDGEWVDSGGHLHYYMRNHPEIKVKHIDAINLNAVSQDLPAQFLLMGPYHTMEERFNSMMLKSLGLDEEQINFVRAGPINIQFFADAHFLHYMTASNWDHKNDMWHARKTMLFDQYINTIIAAAS
jgi:hypothetical protein